MTIEFIKKLAEIRAQEIFTPEYFEKVTDSWYLDEKFRFEELQVPPDWNGPSRQEADLYMKYLDELFDSYRDKFYGGPLAQDAYGKCIDYVDRILKVIEYGNNKYHLFEIDDNTIRKIKDIGNIFVNKHNSLFKKKYD